uniref:Homeobox domain-containing protein n=1 Tax=Anas platyrhynchos platyrhynchos TaxID=8840 RepID=A0A493TGD5_ANAPP
MLRGLFKPRRGRCFKYLPPESNPPPPPTGCERAVAEAPMDKGRFSVEWLAQSSCGGARTVHRHLRDAQDSRPRDLGPGGSERSSPEAEEGGGGAAVPGRPRTKFSAAQLQELERSFREQRYIGASEKRRLAALLNLSQSQIKTWFQNRRMKFKRETQDARVEALVSAPVLLITSDVKTNLQAFHSWVISLPAVKKHPYRNHEVRSPQAIKLKLSRLTGLEVEKGKFRLQCSNQLS